MVQCLLRGLPVGPGGSEARNRRDGATSFDLNQPGFKGIYFGTFLVAAATLALEITLTRLLSVTTWYHLAFFAISIAMLGMTAGAVTVYLRPAWFPPGRVSGSASAACLGYALVVPFALKILCMTGVDVSLSPASLLSLLVVSLAALLPFYFSGVAIAAVVTRSQLPIGRIYASDLIGASTGCLVVLGGLELLDAPSLVLLCACLGALAALSLARHAGSRGFTSAALVTLGSLAVLLAINLFTPFRIEPSVVKGEGPGTAEKIFEEWNSFSRVAVYEGRLGKPQYWAASPEAPLDLVVYQHKMDIDGEAATTLRRFATLADIDHLRYDVANVAYSLRRSGGACIIGVGGGRDIQTAILAGHRRVTGIEINPIFIDLLRGRFREFAGIAGHRGVTLVADEARSHLSRSRETYSIIQMSLTDTWAATGAGAFALSENVLYTVEAWEVFLRRLAGGGIFTVSRWYGPDNVGETGRTLSLAMATLFKMGSTRPSDHLAMVICGQVSTLIVGRDPLSRDDIALLRRVCDSLGFTLILYPGRPPEETDLREIVSAGSPGELRKAVTGKALNYKPPTDENPYFFNMVKLGRVLPSLWSDPGSVTTGTSGVVAGNLVATRVLITLIVILVLLSAITVLFPLALKGRPVMWAGAAYFSLIGAGFMFVEVALIQRLSVFLGHPIYALGILLFSIIASAGLGSLLSDRMVLAWNPRGLLYPVGIVAAIIAIRFILPLVGSGLIAAPMGAKIGAAIAVIVPLGLLLGTAFPVGMRLVRLAGALETPWYWALNGIFGVLCGALTVLISIYSGISTSLYLGALCYSLTMLAVVGILKAAPRAGLE